MSGNVGLDGVASSDAVRKRGIFAWSEYVERIVRRSPPEFGERDGMVITWDCRYEDDICVDSFFVTSYTAMLKLNTAVQGLAKSNGNRAPKYSRLGDGPRRRVLEPYLSIVAQMPGLCVSLVMERSAHRAWERASRLEREKITSMTFKHAWNGYDLFHMNGVAEMCGMLLHDFGPIGGPLRIIFDEDDNLFGSDKQRSDFSKTLRGWSATYRSPIRRELGLVLDKADPFGQWFTALPDLASGALVDIFRAFNSNGPPTVAELKSKTLFLGDWIWQDGKNLKTLVVDIQRGNGKINIGLLSNPFAS